MKKFYFLLVATVVSSSLLAQDAKSVAQKYYNALGGKKAEANIKTFTNKYSMFVMGQSADASESVIVNESSKMTIYVEGIEINQVWNKDHAWATDMMSGGIVDIPADQAGNLRLSTDLFSFIHPDKVNEKYKYLGVKDYNGEKLEGIEIDAFGTPVKMYFDTKGLLKLREINTAAGEVLTEFSDYKELEFGYKVPYKMVIKNPQFDIEMQVTEFLINPDLNPEIFKKP